MGRSNYKWRGRGSYIEVATFATVVSTKLSERRNAASAVR